MAVATKGRMVTIRNFDTKLERVRREHSACAACGMALNHPREFHPFAACLMFKGSGGEGDQTRANLEYVISEAQRAVSDA